MEIIAIVLGAVAVFFIGVLMGKDNPCDDIYHSFNEARLGKLGALETKVYQLETENQRLQHIYESMSRDKRMFHEYMTAHCGTCDRKFYAKTPKEQDVADLLKKITLSSEEIAQKLDIKIL